MPRYEFDPSKATATQEIYPKGDYEFIIGQPKSFIRKNAKGEDSFGIRMTLDIADGDYRGKKMPFTCYLHSDGAQSMSKRFQMAALGYSNNQTEEKRFDVEQAGQDWSFDPETGAVGEAWQKFSGARVIGSLDVGKNEQTGEPQQQQKAWRPITAA